MMIKKYKNSSVIVIKGFYTDDELKLIWGELNFLTPKLLTPEISGSAQRDGVLLKRNKSLFLNSVYNLNVTAISDILSLNTNIFNSDIVKEIKKISFDYNNLDSNDVIFSTLLSYYENDDYYEEHTDSSVYTILTYFYKQPKKFTGGNLILHDINEELEIENNMVVMFPGHYKHSVSKVIMDEADIDKKLGRYCLSQFLKYKY